MTSKLALRLKEKYYGRHTHPYQLYEQEVHRRLSTQLNEPTLLDIGCGREAPTLKRFKGIASKLVGLELVDYRVHDADLTLLSGSITSIPLPDCSINVAIARSVMEHVSDPLTGFMEVQRVLKPGGAFVFLTPSIWDYASIVAMIVPNRFHARVVSMTEGRAEEDVFPTEYKCNSAHTIRRLADAANLNISHIEYLSQYPNYFMFNGYLFFLATLYEKTVSTLPFLNFLRGWILVTLTKPL